MRNPARVLLAPLLCTALVLPAIEPQSAPWRAAPLSACEPWRPAAAQACFETEIVLDAASIEADDLAFYADEIHDADVLAVNGEPAGATPPEFFSAGSDTPVPHEMAGYRRVYPLAARLLKPGVNRLTLAVACEGRRCGVYGDWMVTDERRAHGRQWIDTLFNTLIAAMLLTGALIFVVFGRAAERDNEYRWFSLFVGCGAVMIALHEPAWMPGAWITAASRLHLLSDGWLLPLFIRVLVSATHSDGGRRTRTLAGLLAIAAFVPPLLPIVQGRWVLMGVKAAGLFALVPLLTDMAFRPRRGAGPDHRRLLVVSSLLLSAGAGADLLLDLEIWRSPIYFVDNFIPLAMITAVVLASLALARQYEWLQTTAFHDPLTGLNSRRLMDEQLPGELARASRLGLPVAMLFCDIDFFKRVNDQWGHDTGDRVLREVANRLDATRRGSDMLYRWGGEEFVILLVGQSPAEARQFAERLREAVGARPIDAGGTAGSLPVTISIGISRGGPEAGQAALLADADEALYEAKRTGRNRVVCRESMAV